MALAGVVAIMGDSANSFPYWSTPVGAGCSCHPTGAQHLLSLPALSGTSKAVAGP